MRELTVNLNDYVKVKLTDAGREYLKQYAAEFNKQYPKVNIRMERKEDRHGYSRWQLHDLINTFGGGVAIGKDLLFETDILVEIKG